MSRIANHLERHAISRLTFGVLVGFGMVAFLILIAGGVLTYNELSHRSALPWQSAKERASQPAVHSPPAPTQSRPLPRQSEREDEEKAGEDLSKKKEGQARENFPVLPTETDKDEPGRNWPECKNPENGKESDLCAQWEAAHQGFVANDIARSQLLLTVGNLLVSLFVGALAGLGVVLAAHASDLAAKAIRQGRDFERGRVAAVITRSGKGRFFLALSNVGGSVARVTRVCLAAPDGRDLLVSDEVRHLREGADDEKLLLVLAGAVELALTVHYVDADERRHECRSIFERRGAGFVCTAWNEQTMQRDQRSQ